MNEREQLNELRVPSKDNPLRMLMSACLTGITCGYDGSANGEYPSALKFLNYDTVKITRFCPEEFSFGSPREMCDIHGGAGIDVLNGKAKVLTASGKDWTDGMIQASEKMLEIAKNENIEIAVLMDISAACGSQVIYQGNRFDDNKTYQIGAGVCAAQLIRNGIKVISQRDFASLEIIYAKIDYQHVIDPTKIDHHETEWYKNYFKV
ncbi:MAG: 2-thiouracil desulfurase family protein [Bacteroidota bacterium]|nr:2-thiouracil desulfurase family protein [Bacteroidota bacterium]